MSKKNIYMKMKIDISPEQWIEIIRWIASFLIGVITTLFVQSCTLSLSVSKNNTNSNQKTEQVSTVSVDSTHVYLKEK